MPMSPPALQLLISLVWDVGEGDSILEVPHVSPSPHLLTHHHAGPEPSGVGGTWASKVSKLGL
jgi:hypothetical protein